MKPDRRSTTRLLCAGLILAAAAFGIWRWTQAPISSQLLSDGSRLSLVEVQLGMTNTFTIGTSWQRSLGWLAPSNGISMLGFKLSRPEKRTFQNSEESLLLLFRLAGATNATNPLLDRGYDAPQLRLVVRAASGHEYEGYLARFDSVKIGVDRYAFGELTAFPRDEKWIVVRVVADRESQRQEVAQFRLRNPSIRSSLSWKAEDTPVTRRFDDIEMTLGEITMGPRCWRVPTNPDETGSIPLRVMEECVVATNWTLHDIRARDGLGNYSHISSFPILSNDWCYHPLWGGLDPTRVWKLEAHLSEGPSYHTRAEDFSSDELFTIRLTMPLKQSFQTNFIGVPLEFKPWNFGLEVTMQTNRSDLRLSFVSLNDADGNKYENSSGNWGQWHFARSFDSAQPQGLADLTFAIHRDYYFECFVLPRRKEMKP